MNAPMGRLVPTALLIAGLLACGTDDPSPSLRIEGAETPIVMGLTRQFTAHFAGTSADSVVWSLPAGELSGTIDGTGLYTAGMTAGTWPVVATSADDPTLTDTLTATVIPYATTLDLSIPAYGIAINAAGTIAAADNDGHVRFRTAGGTITSAAVPGNPVHLVFSKDGASVLVTTMGWKLYRVDVTTATRVDSVGFDAPVFNIALDPVHDRLVVSTQTGKLIRLDPTTLAKLDTIDLQAASNGLAFAPGGGTLWASAIEGDSVYRIDPATFEVTERFLIGAGGQRIAVAPSGDSVYVANQNSGRVYIINPTTHTTSYVTLPFNPHGVGISADGSRLFVAQLGGRATVLTRGTMQMLGAIPLPEGGRNVLAIPGGNSVLISTEGHLIRVD